MTKLQDKYGPWALITGASSGLGSAFARQLANEGLNLVLVARREDRLRALARDLEQQTSVEVRVVAGDLSREGFLEPIKQATDDLEISLLVNNAGRTLTSSFLLNDLASELAMLDLNTRAPLVLTHHFGNQMKARGRGGIIFMASVVGLAGVGSWSNYAATKGHSLVFAEGLAEELGKDGVDVLAVAPAFIRTEFMELSPFGRLLSVEPDKVARVALAALGHRRIAIPTWLHRLIAWSTRIQPRILNTKIFSQVVARAHE